MSETQDIVPVPQPENKEPEEILAELLKLEGKITSKTLDAWDIIATGVVPKTGISTRPGYPDEIKYVAHTYVQQVMNAAFRYLWDFQVLSYQVHDDGSTSALCQMTVMIPIGTDKDGNTIFHKRTITEVGAFESYMKTDKQTHKPILDPVTGKPTFTMSVADRVASAASRGLVKCAFRGFNLGLQLSAKGEPELTPLEQWRKLLDRAYKLGVSRERTIELCKTLGIKEENLVRRFQEAYIAIYYEAMGQENTIPDDLK